MDSKKKKVLIIDTSAILSGKPLIFDKQKTVTTQGVSDELKPGGKDYQNFQYLLEMGLKIESPTKKSMDEINNVSSKTGDVGRLSKTDKEILALAMDIKKNTDEQPVILTDDFSIQNIANNLDIKYESISQKGIKKRFKWGYRCRGCGKKFEEHIKVCPICGSTTKNIVTKKTDMKKSDK